MNINLLLKRLLFGLGFVFIAHLCVAAYYFDKVSVIAFRQALPLDLFLFEFEKNIPSYFSAFLLMLCGYFLRQISFKADSFQKTWRFLGGLFYFLAADEWFSLHENLNVIDASFLGAPSWVLVYGPLALIFAVAMIRFLKSLPVRTALQFIFAGVIYVSGAAVFEVINSWVGTFSFNDIYYQVFLFFEDGLEMAGAFVFVAALTGYYRSLTHEDTIPFAVKGFSIITGIAFIESVITFLVN